MSVISPLDAVLLGVLSAQSARETFVATLGQVAAAENPDEPSNALQAMTCTDGPHAGQPVFTAPTIAALLVYFAFAMQCMATIGIIRRETGGWKWPPDRVQLPHRVGVGHGLPGKNHHRTARG